MKEKVVRNMRKWAVGAIFLAGLMYAVSALTITTETAYANACNCGLETDAAEQYCLNLFGSAQLEEFHCPVGAAGNEFSFMCAADPFDNLITSPCQP